MNKFKKVIKGFILRLVNHLPVTSLIIGSPRHINTAKELSELGDTSITYLSFKEEKQINELPPGTIDSKVFFKFFPLYNRIQPEVFLLKLKNGRVWGNQGAILSSTDTLIADLSKEFGPAKFDITKHSIFNRIQLKKFTRFYGKVAVIASPGTDVYAHWIADITPRLLILKNSNLLNQVDQIILNYSKTDFQIETLSLLGIQEHQILNCIDEPEFHLIADYLYVPSYPNSHGTVNPWVCEELNKIFKIYSPQKLSSGHKRYYISRSRANGRKLLNESELFFFLKNELGFEILFTENFTIKEKAEIFSNADCIIAPHGGGLTNVVFCKSGCKIIDIFPPGDFDTFFWSMANSVKIDYYYYFGKGELPNEINDFNNRNSDIDLDLNRFKIFVKNIISQ